MLHQLNHNTFFYDARSDSNYDKIDVFMRVSKQKKTKSFVDIKDKNILRKYKINSFLNKSTILKNNINLIIYRHDENYYYCKDLLDLKLIDSKELILNFDSISSSSYMDRLCFYTEHISQHKSFFMKHFSCNNIIELVKRFH